MKTTLTILALLFAIATPAFACTTPHTVYGQVTMSGRGSAYPALVQIAPVTDEWPWFYRIERVSMFGWYSFESVPPCLDYSVSVWRKGGGTFPEVWIFPIGDGAGIRVDLAGSNP